MKDNVKALTGSLSKAFAQLSDPKFLKIILASAFLSLLVFIGITALVVWGVNTIGWTDISYVGWIFSTLSWIGRGLQFLLVDWWLGTDTATFIFQTLLYVGTLFLGIIFLFPPVMTAIIGLFAEAICDRVEARYYPNLPTPRKRKLSEDIFNALRFMGYSLGVNILVLPVYLILSFLPPFNLIAYYFVNASLIGREYYEMVAFRRLTPAYAIALRHSHRHRLRIAGFIITIGMTIPIVNLLIGALGVAMMVHFYQKLPKRTEFEFLSRGLSKVPTDTLVQSQQSLKATPHPKALEQSDYTKNDKDSP